MTFQVVSISDSQEKIVGTIWADGESHAQLMASALSLGGPDGSFIVRQADDRDFPMRLAEYYNRTGPVS